MTYSVETYTFPADFIKAIQDGRISAGILKQESVTGPLSSLGYSVCLDLHQRRIETQRSGLIGHFIAERANAHQMSIDIKNDQEDARAVVIQAIAYDACAWTLAQNLIALSPTDQQAIESYHKQQEPAIAAALTTAFRLALSTYVPGYRGDPRIHRILQMPYILRPTERLDDCLSALAQISRAP